MAKERDTFKADVEAAHAELERSMSDRDKVIEYELQIEDLLNAIKSRISEFEDGRKCAYLEIMDMIENRCQMIHEVIEE